MAATVYARMPLNYNDMGDYELTKEDLKRYDEIIGSLLPDCLTWCGDELLVECDNNRQLDEETKKELEGFDLQEILQRAFEIFCNETEH